VIINQLPDNTNELPPRSRPCRSGGPPPARRRGLVVSLLLALLVVAGLGVVSTATASPASAGDPESSVSASTTTTVVGQDDGGIIPRPNSGHEPEDAGDRGGSLQILVFGLVLAGMAAIALLAVRDSRKAKARAAEREAAL
jgi:hypothetical protein